MLSSFLRRTSLPKERYFELRDECKVRGLALKLDDLGRALVIPEYRKGVELGLTVQDGLLEDVCVVVNGKFKGILKHIRLPWGVKGFYDTVFSALDDFIDSLDGSEEIAMKEMRDE